MREFRADGTLPGEAVFARIYKMSGEGKVWYVCWKGERQEDFPSYIPKYKQFRGFMTDFFPVAEANEKLNMFNTMPLPAEEVQVAKVEFAREKAEEAAKKFKVAAQELVNTIPPGHEHDDTAIAINEIFAAMQAVFK